MNMLSRRRALLYGGIGAGLLLPWQKARAQSCSPTQSFTSFAYPASGAPTNRTTPARLSDIVNVLDYGATGNGSTDDAAAIQAAINAAFGSSSSPNGVSGATNNKLVFFPNGNYHLSTPIVLTNVYGGRLVGSGQFTTSIGGTSGAFITNGASYCSFENFYINSNGASTGVTFELDWNGSGSVGLHGNVFYNCSFNDSAYPLRIGHSGNDGANNSFFGCFWGNGSTAGIGVFSSAALGNIIDGGGPAGNAIGVWMSSGQISTMNQVSLADNSTCDVQIDSNVPVLIQGSRTESTLHVIQNGTGSTLVINGGLGSSTNTEWCRPKGKVIIDACSPGPSSVLCSSSSYTGTVYLRGGVFPGGFTSGFAGTIAQNI